MPGDRTQIEEQMVLKSLLPYELEAVGKALVDLIKKAPAELRPAALGVALATIGELSAAADAAVAALPDYPASLSAEALKKRAAALKHIYRHLQPGASPSVFLSGLSLISSVDDTVNPLSSDPPVFPHDLTQRFIDHQANLLMEYVAKNALK